MRIVIINGRVTRVALKSSRALKFSRKNWAGALEHTLNRVTEQCRRQARAVPLMPIQ
jgi:hypothetical protein